MNHFSSCFFFSRSRSTSRATTSLGVLARLLLRRTRGTGPSWWRRTGDVVANTTGFQRQRQRRVAAMLEVARVGGVVVFVLVVVVVCT